MIEMLRRLLRARILQNMSWLAGSYAIAKPLWFFFITAVCMRLLTPGDYGIFTASLALAMLTSSIGDLGTSRYSTREIARRPGVAARLFSNVLPARVGLAFSGFLIALLVGVILQYPSNQFMAVVGAGVYTLAFRATEYCRAFFQAFEVLKYEGILTIVEKVLVVALGFVALLLFRSPVMLFVGMSAGMILALASHVWVVHTRLTRFSVRLLSPHYMRRVVWMALPIGLVGVLGAVPSGAIPVIVDAYLGNVDAGLYGAAQRIIDALNMVATILVVAVFPRFSTLFHRGEKESMIRLFRRAVAGLVAVSIAVSVGLTFTAELIIMLLSASTTYIDASGLLKILAVGYPFMSITMISLSALIAMDSLRFATFSMGAGALTSVLLALILIPILGTPAAAIAFASGYVVSTCANLYGCRIRFDDMAQREEAMGVGDSRAALHGNVTA